MNLTSYESLVSIETEAICIKNLKSLFEAVKFDSTLEALKFIKFDLDIHANTPSS